MTHAELSEMDATAQAAAIAGGRLSSVEAVDAAIAGAEAVDPQLNCIVHERFDRARSEAVAADAAPLAERGPLHGVPVVIKDLDGTLGGEPYWAGSNYLKRLGYVATETSVLFQRLIGAGAVIIAATNTPELGLVPSTEPVSVGPCRNPWDLARSPAGSSGGSAAAVAAGIVALGHAGDGGGSIRMPAASCGLVGLKPSRGLVPTSPEIDPWGGLVARLAVTRTVADTALALDVLGGPDPLGSPQVRAPGQGRHREGLATPPPPLRIAWTSSATGGGEVCAAVRDTVEATADHLAEEGHLLSEAAPDLLGDEELIAQVTAWFFDAFAVWVRQSTDDLLARGGEPFQDGDLEAHTLALRELGAAVPSDRYAAAVEGLMHAGRRIRAFWADQPYDLLLTPTCPEVPWPLGGFGAEPDNPMAAVMRAAELVPFATPFNISGQPAVSLPVAVVDGLPVGAQLVAPWGREDLLLAVGSQLERRLAWQDRRPPVHVASA
ncbi:MAG: amidase [Microthrixaceae bacterium]